LLNRTCHITLLLFLLASICYAQDIISPRGRFSVQYTRGCNPFSVTATNRISAPQIRYYLRYKNRADIEELTGNTANISAEDTLYLVQVAESLQPPKDSLMLISYKPEAPIFDVTACSGNGAIVEVSSRNYDYYEVQFNNQPAVRADQSTSYRASGQFGAEGNHTVTVRGRYNNDAGNCAPATTTTTSWASLPVAEMLGLQFNQQKDSVYIQYRLVPGILYQLERRSSPSEPYQPLFQLKAPATASSLHQPGMSATAYCYRISAVDVCNSSSGAAAASEELCTAAWSVTVQNGFNQIQYLTHTGFSGTVELQRQGGTVISTGTASGGEFIDENVICKETYCYQLILRPQGSSGGTAAVSSPVCVEALNSNPLRPINNIVSRWLPDNRLLVYPVLATNTQNASYTLSNQDGRRLTAAVADSLLLQAAPSNQCYQLNYTDQCGNRATSATQFCPLFLDNLSTEPDELVLSWNAYEGYAEGVDYYKVEELDASGDVISSWDTGTETTYSNFGVLSADDNGRRFRVLAFPKEGGIKPSFSNIYTYELVMNGYFPNAFSPNDDGLNDTFKILGKFVEQATLWVYSRWGEVIFYSNDKEAGWDGTYSGKPVPVGPYTYKAVVVTADGKQKQVTGTVFLTR
jgi:gliding motility-associated-like protein